MASRSARIGHGVRAGVVSFGSSPTSSRSGGNTARRGLRRRDAQEEIKAHEANERSQNSGSGEDKRQTEHGSGAPQAGAGFAGAERRMRNASRISAGELSVR